MGHKVHPRIFRIKQLYTWDSRWFSEKNYSTRLRQDIMIQDFLKTELKDALVDKIEIDRAANSLTINIHAAKPGIIIGRAGVGAEELKKKIINKFLKKKMIPGQGKLNLNINIQEVAKPNLSAAIVMQSIIADLEKRIPFRRTMKQMIGKVEKTEAKGIKITLSGRLDGAEIARRETMVSGRIPRHNLRADIDYAAAPARTIYGAVGVKVWIYRGEVFEKPKDKVPEAKAPEAPKKE